MKVKLWQKSDLNGFFGLFTNLLTNMIVMASLLSVVVGLPNDIVFGRIIPAVGVSIFLSSVCYSFMAYKLAKKTGRNDVTALPAGASVPHMFLIVFLVLGPIYWSTNDANLAWGAALAWCVCEGIIEVLGAFIGNKLRKWLPRAALLGSLAGVSITYIALNPAFATFAVPYIGLVSLIIVLISFVGNIKLPFNLPTGLVVIIIGVVIGWATGLMKPENLMASFQEFQVGYPIPSFLRIFSGFEKAAPFLVAAVPLGVYNFFETLDNCESAAAAGDEYNTTHTMLCDGVTSIIAAVLGSPFPTAVFLGHPGWKKAGARIGYSFASGLAMMLICCLGIVSVILNIVPVEAIYPILLYVGVSMMSQSFTDVKSKYAPAVIMGILPSLADWTINEVNIGLDAAGKGFAEIGQSAMQAAGLNYLGASALGTGAVVIGVIWATITVAIIDRQFIKGAIACGVGAILTFFGIIHANSLAINANLGMTIGYLLAGAILVGYYYLLKKKPEMVLPDEELPKQEENQVAEN